MIKKFSGSIMLFIAALLWGTTFVAQSDGMNYIEPFTYNGIRTLIGGVVLIPVIAVFRGVGKKRGTLQPYSKKNTVIGGVICGAVLFIASSLQQSGMVWTTAGKAGFITALYLVIVPLLGLFFGRRVKIQMWFFVALAIGGFWLLCINEDFNISVGDLLVLGCAVFFAVHILVIDRFNTRETDGMMMSCIQFFTAGTLMIICMFIFEKPDLGKILEAWFPILYAGIMSSGVAYTLQILGQRRVDPAPATLLMSLESVFAALSGWVILGEQLSLKEFLGCVLVFAAVILSQLLGNKSLKKKDKSK